MAKQFGQLYVGSTYGGAAIKGGKDFPKQRPSLNSALLLFVCIWREISQINFPPTRLLPTHHLHSAFCTKYPSFIFIPKSQLLRRSYLAILNCIAAKWAVLSIPKYTPPLPFALNPNRLSKNGEFGIDSTQIPTSFSTTLNSRHSLALMILSINASKMVPSSWLKLKAAPT